MIKLLLIVSSYEINGTSGVVKNLINFLDRNKFKLILLADKIQKVHFPIPSDVEVINLDIKPKAYFWDKFFNVFRYIVNLRKKIILLNPDLVFSLCYPISCYLLVKPIKNLEEKIVVGEYSEGPFVKLTTHNLRYIFFETMFKIIMFFVYWRAVKIVAVSESLGKHLEQLFRVDKKKIKIIPSLVDIAEIKRRSEESVSDYIFEENFLYFSLLSRLSPEKGIVYLLEAFAKLRQEVKAKLIIIGEGSHRLHLEKMVKLSNLQEDVTFMGSKENPFKYLKRTDIFVLPSLYEGSPTAILESFVCEVPVIASKCVAGIEEMINNGKDGILVNPADVHALYNALYKLALNKELRKKLKSEAEKKVNKYDILRLGKEYQNLFLETYTQNNN